MQQVKGDRIIDSETGKEVLWRGAGGSYLFHAIDYMQAWQLHLPEIQKMGLNTVRLAFRFPFDFIATADLFDYDKLDNILTFLDANNIKAILDNHGAVGMGGEDLKTAWREVATKYAGDSRIAAFELFNEPSSGTWDSSITTKMELTHAYRDLTSIVKEIDPNRITIWQTSGYLPPFNEIADLLMPNVVYTAHRWWTRSEWEFEIWTPQQISYLRMADFVRWRKDYNVPIWLGEFGLGGGGNAPYDHTNPHSQVCEELLFRCEEQVVGWNLWQGKTAIDKPWYAADMFPLKVFNESLIRKRWFMSIPDLTSYVIEQKGVDIFSSSNIALWHNGDYVTLKPGVVVRFIRNHKLPDGSFEVVEDMEIAVTTTTMFINVEGTTEYPGDWNVKIYPIGYLPSKIAPLILVFLFFSAIGGVILSRHRR